MNTKLLTLAAKFSSYFGSEYDPTQQEYEQAIDFLLQYPEDEKVRNAAEVIEREMQARARFYREGY